MKPQFSVAYPFIDGRKSGNEPRERKTHKSCKASLPACFFVERVLNLFNIILRRVVIDKKKREGT